MYIVLMIYLVVALVFFVAALISEIRSPEPGRECSRIAILVQCVAEAVSWPLILLALIIIPVGDWFFRSKSIMGEPVVFVMLTITGKCQVIKERKKYG
jgi:hypothetical protein